MKQSIFLSMVILLNMAGMHLQAVTAGNETKNGDNTPSQMHAKSKSDVVSVLTRASFQNNFRNAKHVVWNRPGNFQEATFTTAGKELTAYFDGDHRLIGSTAVRSFSDLPLQGQKKIESSYKDYTVRSVIYFEANQDNETPLDLYAGVIDNPDNYFVEISNNNSRQITSVKQSIKRVDGFIHYMRSVH